jgi:transposase-like protein
MKPRPSSAKEVFYSVDDFNHEFANDDACLEYIKEQRWPNGVTKCEKCDIERKHHRVTGRTAYACDHCGNHIYPLTGTVFAKSTTSLKTWFYVIYLMGSANSSLSAKRIQRETGVTYKTAWRTWRQIRRLLTNEDLQLERPAAATGNGDASALSREGESAGSLTMGARETGALVCMRIASD